MAETPLKPVLLLILDGWGLAKEGADSAIARAETPTWDKLKEHYPLARLVTHGEAVGLLKGQMGNSEVGHLNLGAGRVVYQDSLLIRRMIESGELAAHEQLNRFLRTCARQTSVLHFIGLLSDGGVHSHVEHLRGLIAHARRRGVKRIWIHAMTDGRDTPRRVAERYFALVADKMPAGVGFATLGGRYFGMDRDRRWERTRQAWEAIVHADGPRYRDWEVALNAARQRDETDEFIEPSVLGEYQGIRDGDHVLCFNYRADRMRQLVSAFLFDEFGGFDRGRVPTTELFSARRYRGDFDNEVLLKDEVVPQTLIEVLSERGLGVYKSAETTKYAHVTYFFNGGRENPWPGEDRVLVQSPMVATFDQKPEMSAYEVADQLVQRLKQGAHALFVVNFANGDMVGHSGVVEACIRAAEALDHCLEQILGAVHWGKDVSVVITADHGNMEELCFDDGSTSTQHSMNDVPLILVADPPRALKAPRANAEQRPWSLCDVAPTVLELLGIEAPASWTGVSLLA